MKLRLQKIISAAGVASRRKAEELIQTGRVAVNGRIITELGSKADPDKDTITVNGRRIEPRQPRLAVLLNKPDGYITSMKDPEGRPTVAQLVDSLGVRVYPVGRLDYHTEGLLILTNDGDLAQSIEHPSNEIEKTYHAKVKGVPEHASLQKLRTGVMLDDRKTSPAKIKVLETRKNAWLEVKIHEGRQNQIRGMFESIGHPVLKLKRVAIGALTDHKLKPGKFRLLTAREISAITGKKQRRPSRAVR